MSFSETALRCEAALCCRDVKTFMSFTDGPTFSVLVVLRMEAALAFSATKRKRGPALTRGPITNHGVAPLKGNVRKKRAALLRTLHWPWEERDRYRQHDRKPVVAGLDDGFHHKVRVRRRAAGSASYVVDQREREEEKNAAELRHPVDPRLRRKREFWWWRGHGGQRKKL